MATKKVEYPQRGKLRRGTQEEVKVLRPSTEAGIKLYEVEFDDGVVATFVREGVILQGPWEDA